MNQQEMLKVSDEVEHIGLRLTFLENGIREYRENSQWFLREFVTNKDFPLRRRFWYWEKYCEKITCQTRSALFDGDDFGLIGKLIGAEFYLAGVVVCWNDILALVANIQDEPEMGYGIFLNLTLNDVQEALIEENFGSCRLGY